MNYIMLVGAIGAGVCGTLLTRASRGFSRWGHALAALCSYGLATVLMAWLVERLPVGVVYAVWSGSAAAVLLVIDRFTLDIHLTRQQVAGMVVTIAGVAVLGTAVH